MVKDCQRPIKLDNGTASFPQAKEYQKMKIAGLELSSDNSESESSESSESSENSSSTGTSDILDKEYLDESEEEQVLQEEGNWWDSPESSD